MKIEERIRDQKGRFSEGDKPPSKPVLVYLPQPIIDALDDYGREQGTGRGKSIQRLLQGVLDPIEQKPIDEVVEKDKVRLELVKSSNPLYIEYRKKHYIPNRGTVGQQLQYLIFYKGEVVGVIGGASAVYKSAARDAFFGLSDEKYLKTRQLNSIVNNNIFKLDYPVPNLATIILKKWRKQIAKDWEYMYGVEVYGYETFVVEERLWNGQTRNGGCYRADNWELVGLTKGYGKTNTRGRTHNNKLLQSKKLIYCIKNKNKKLCTEYETSWNDSKKIRELMKKRDAIMQDPLDLLIKSVRES